MANSSSNNCGCQNKRASKFWWNVSKDVAAVAPPRWGKGGSFQKLCNMCVLSLSWNFFVSHDKYIARPSSKELRWYTDNTTGTGGLRTLDPLLTHTSLPPLQNPGGATVGQTSLGRPFQILGPAAANERSPTVATAWYDQLLHVR